MIRNLLIFLLFFSLISGCAKEPAPPPLVFPDFDKARAFQFINKQVDFGPRVPGTAAHDSCLTFLETELKKYADSVTRQSFQHIIKKTGENVSLTNLVASFGGKQGRRFLLAAHWDSRPWADSETDSLKKRQAVPGANDGGSGVAVLLEIARILKENEPPVGVDIVFFDGEDFGMDGDEDSWAVGAQYFARTKSARYAPQLGLLLDMIGDKDLRIMKEGHSVFYAPGVVDAVWNYASRIGLPAFSSDTMGPITDDHLPLLKVGIPIINLIDLDYPAHHTTTDTPDKCSPESLEQVGKLALAVIYNPPS